jgi:hypothetical protein
LQAKNASRPLFALKGKAFKANNGLTDREAIPLPEKDPLDWEILCDT